MSDNKFLSPATFSVSAGTNPGWFTRFMADQKRRKSLVVQPRMGFGSTEQMRRGLLAVQQADATTIGTITLDSYTRVNDYQAAYQALVDGHDLNGFPLVTHGPEVTQQMLEGIIGDDFPVQVRHGSALPLEIFKAILRTGLDATEGGPVSYCLPYSRVPLRLAIKEWGDCCRLFASERSQGKINHLESFGGCMLGQLCPPSLLVALSILEGVFFRHHGLASISLSYAQQTNLHQDCEAVAALRLLADQYLSDVDWHIVIYTYMGVYPRTLAGATSLLQESVKLAISTRSERLIVKTPVEASRIPTIEENVAALEVAATSANAYAEDRRESSVSAMAHDSEVYAEAVTLVETVLALSSDPGEALALAFEGGLLDVPFCLHPSNRNLARSFIDDRGWLQWADSGRMPLPGRRSLNASGRVTAYQLMDMLSYNERRFDTQLLAHTTKPMVTSEKASMQALPVGSRH